jgi:hypothetical protein
MNLRIGHLPVLLGGALTGSALGYLLCVAARGFFPDVKDLPALGLVFGSLAGLFIVVFAIIVAASRDRDADVPAQFTSVNGIGSTLYGKSDPRDDGSYVTTEWFTVFFVPILPVCSYRVIRIDRTILAAQYRILGKSPPRASHIIKGYAFTVAVAVSIIVLALCARN